MPMATLRLDWATAQAAEFACRHWHYAASPPRGKVLRIGVWEDGCFVGVVCFGQGANYHIGTPYGLKNTQCCELVRIALTKHTAPVSRIVAIALRMLRQQCPGLRLVVSYADPAAGHHGGVYQAGGWLYTGTSADGFEFRDAHGRRLQKRTYTGVVFGKPRTKLPIGAVKVATQGKHRYLMPLDEAIRAQVQQLVQPYPSPRVKGNSSNGAPIPGRCNSDPRAPISPPGQPEKLQEKPPRAR